LGDDTSFAATLFNLTLVCAELCVIAIGLFSVRMLVEARTRNKERSGISPREVVLVILFAFSGFPLSGVGAFRYALNPVAHDLCAKGVMFPMYLILLALPWLAPHLSRRMYVGSDLIVAVTAIAGVLWMRGALALTFIERFSMLLFMVWFLAFSREIARLASSKSAGRTR
jgi:hypothetical protein